MNWKSKLAGLTLVAALAGLLVVTGEAPTQQAATAQRRYDTAILTVEWDKEPVFTLEDRGGKLVRLNAADLYKKLNQALNAGSGRLRNLEKTETEFTLCDVLNAMTWQSGYRLVAVEPSHTPIPAKDGGEIVMLPNPQKKGEVIAVPDPRDPSKPLRLVKHDFVPMTRYYFCRP